jgi:hypothetical protein
MAIDRIPIYSQPIPQDISDLLEQAGYGKAELHCIGDVIELIRTNCRTLIYVYKIENDKYYCLIEGLPANTSSQLWHLVNHCREITGFSPISTWAKSYKDAIETGIFIFLEKLIKYRQKDWKRQWLPPGNHITTGYVNVGLVKFLKEQNNE